MFKILGGDGKEYGPVTVEQIKQWVHEGRANHETMAQPSGGIGWKPLAQYPEFADLFGTPPPPAPAPAGGAPAEGEPAPTQSAPAEDMPAMVASVAPVIDGRSRAEQLVRGPAIGLIVTAALGIAFAIFGLVWNAYFGAAFMPPVQNLPPETVRMLQLLRGPAMIVVRFVAIAVGVVILFGGLQMMRLRSYGYGITVAILAMIPCFSPCCWLGLPIGIWALVVLGQSEVRAHFDRPAAS